MAGGCGTATERRSPATPLPPPPNLPLPPSLPPPLPPPPSTLLSFQDWVIIYGAMVGLLIICASTWVVVSSRRDGYCFRLRPHPPPRVSPDHLEAVVEQSVQSAIELLPCQVWEEADAKASGREEEEEDERAQCSLCLSNYEAGEEVTRLTCGHAFHKACVTRWLGEAQRGEKEVPIVQLGPARRGHDCDDDATRDAFVFLIALAAEFSARAGGSVNSSILPAARYVVVKTLKS